MKHQVHSKLGLQENPSSAATAPPALGQNGSQQYAFLDFVSTGGAFDKVVISEGNSGNFEADNETVGYISDPHPTGTALTPEPDDFGMIMIGAGFLLGSFGLRRRSNQHRTQAPLPNEQAAE